jgi:hypothetical protein
VSRDRARRDAETATVRAGAVPPEGIGPATIAHRVQALALEIRRATGPDEARDRSVAQRFVSGTST